MPFTPKDWKDYPDTSTPITAAALEDVETRLAAFTAGRTPISVTEFGAVGNGTTDDTTAIQAAISALPTNGGTLFFPAGTYKFSSKLDFEGKRSVALVGVGGMSGGASPASVLSFSGTGTGDAISFRSTAGCSMRDLSVFYTSSSFTGTLVSLAHGTSGADSAYFTMERCFLAGASVTTAGRLVDLDTAIICEFHDSYFYNAVNLIRGKAENTGYSNAILFDGCTFKNWTSAGVRDVDEAWTFLACTWEGDATTPTANANGIIQDTGFSCKNLTVIGNWFGDVGNGNDAGDWVQFSGDGLVFHGNRVGGATVGVRVGYHAAATSVSIMGNRFDLNRWAVVANAAGTNQRWMIVNNTHLKTDNGAFISWAAGAMPTGGSIVQNESTSGAGGSVTTAAGGSGWMMLGTIPVREGAVTDGNFPYAPPDGTMMLDSTNTRVYFRLGGAWKYAALS